MTVWSDLLKAIQLKPRYLFGVWLLGCLLLMLPWRMASGLGVVEFRDHYRGWVGLVTLAAFSLWLAQLIPLAHGKWSEGKWKKKVLKNLDGLSPPERFLLAYCVYRGQRTVYLRITDPAATSLCDKGLMQQASGTGSMLAWPCTIPGFVWNHIYGDRLTILPDNDWKSPELREAFGRFEKDMQDRFY